MLNSDCCAAFRIPNPEPQEHLLWDSWKTTEAICDEWGGAESRWNGARPVELMMMSDTCATHRSRVPRRSYGRIKGGATTVEDERGPGLDFICVLCAAVVREGLPLYCCVWLFVLLNSLKC